LDCRIEAAPGKSVRAARVGQLSRAVSGCAEPELDSEKDGGCDKKRG
jgi:hypothetical protein